MKYKLFILSLVFLVGCSLSGNGSSNKNGLGDSSNSAKLSNHYYSKDAFMGELLQVVSNGKITSKKKKGSKATIELDILFNNPSQRRLDIQLDLIKYIDGNATESFFVGPKTMTLLPNSVEKLHLKNLRINEESEFLKIVFIYSYQNKRQMKEIELKHLTRQEYERYKVGNYD